MTDDVISTDPQMREEARRAASESSIPKPPYDPKAVAREEFERVADKSGQFAFEELWDVLVKQTKDEPLSAADVVGTLTEAEFRQMFAAICYKLNALSFLSASKEAHERAEVLNKAAMFSASDRLKLREQKITETRTDVARGVLRLPPKKKTCPVHPDGCPTDEKAVAKDFIEFLSALVGKK